MSDDIFVAEVCWWHLALLHRCQPRDPTRFVCNRFKGRPCRSVVLPSSRAFQARLARLTLPRDSLERIQWRYLAPEVYFQLYAKPPTPAVEGPYRRA